MTCVLILLVPVLVCVMVILCFGMLLVAVDQLDVAFRPVLKVRTGRVYHSSPEYYEVQDPPDDTPVSRALDTRPEYRVVFDDTQGVPFRYHLDEGLPDGTRVAIYERVGWSGRIHTSEPAVLLP